MIIYLGLPSQEITNDLTRGFNGAGRPSRLLFGLSSSGVCHAGFITETPVVSYTTFSPLLFCKERSIFCGTFRLQQKSLSQFSPEPGSYPAPYPVKPGLSSHPPRRTGDHPRIPLKSCQWVTSLPLELKERNQQPKV